MHNDECAEFAVLERLTTLSHDIIRVAAACCAVELFARYHHGAGLLAFCIKV